MRSRRFAAVIVCLAGLVLTSCGTRGGPAVSAQSVQSAAGGGVEYNGVVYTVSGAPESMDILAPKPGHDRMPVVLCIHGGSWTYGSRSDMRGAMPWLVGQGYAACTIDYRLAPASHFPAQIEDCKCAVRYLRAHADTLHIDPDRIGVLGLSAGAQLGLLLGLTPKVIKFEGTGGWPGESSKVQCVIDLEGPTDFSTMLNVQPIPPNTRNTMESVFGGALESHRQAVIEASPITYVKRGEPPILIMQGDQDTLVPLSQSQSLYARLKACGDDVTIKVIKGIGHGPLEEFAAPDNLTLVQGFLDRTLQAAK